MSVVADDTRRKSIDTGSAAFASNRRNFATSFASFFSKLRPSKRAERGGTIRSQDGDGHIDADQEIRGGRTCSDVPIPRRASSKTGQGTSPLDYHNSNMIPPGLWNMPTTLPRRFQTTNRKAFARRALATAAANQVISKPSDRVQELFLEKQEARRQRRTLKECGDFLGVTGVNPYTREMDVLTPTTSSDDALSPANSQLAELAQKAHEAQAAYKQAKREMQTLKEQERWERVENRKDAIRLGQREVKWHHEKGQWSSAAEPKLSPIAQSQASVASAARDATTIHRSQSSFLGTIAATEHRRTALSINQETMTPTVNCQQEQRRDGRAGMSNNLGQGIPILSKTKMIRLRLPPIIPRRLGSSPEDASPTENDKNEKNEIKSEALDEIAAPQPLRYRFPPSDSMSRIPSGKVLEVENQNPAERWASRLIQDLDDLERSLEMKTDKMGQGTNSLVERTNGQRGEPRSACTHITTTIGFACSRSRPTPSRAYDEMIGMLDRGPLMVVSTVAGRQTAATPGRPPTSRKSSGVTFSGVCMDLLASPLTLRPSVWPSLTRKGQDLNTTGRIVEIMTSDKRPALPPPPPPLPEAASATTSVCETPTKDCEISPRKTATGGQQKEISGLLMKATGNAVQQPSVSLTACRPSIRSPTHLVGGPELDHAIARGAARAAFVQHMPMSKPTGGYLAGVVSGLDSLAGVQQQAAAPALAAKPTDNKASREGGGDLSVDKAPQQLVSGLWTTLLVIRELACAYWRLMSPVLDANSPLRKRFSQTESTWEDCITWVLAMLFLLLAASNN
ncbi:hypothetical protein B0T26DRAFT_676337 [Lasiosphaeria miniovina]|uniref:Uncharacterized protein n=1 Tax=Lasiosphaeria miniovina TaxID=1954250 RepID=A0AA40ALN5_9PEZI|nr:uncharacterized protein B0T26DRAFT_676337 [Lasiosphaeria miniovina]KAK0718136.1 hypothetical protein B0T26DRAFT_676337 [Lasiosphaeria miniovina]